MSSRFFTWTSIDVVQSTVLLAVATRMGISNRTEARYRPGSGASRRSSAPCSCVLLHLRPPLLLAGALSAKNGGDPGGIRTRDLDLERVASWARLDDGVSDRSPVYLS